MKKSYKTICFFAGGVCLALFAACSSDLFDPPEDSPEAPVIERIEASAWEVDPGDTVTLKVIVGEANGDVLKYAWSADGGSFIPPADESEVQWIAPPRGGWVTLSVKVSNEDKSAEESSRIIVRSYTKPQVEITAPKSGAFIIQSSVVAIEATATHSNGIRRVDFWIGDSLYSPTYFSGDTYRLDHRFDDPAGPLWIKVMATANVTGAVGTDSIQVHVEGIIVGKARQ